MNPEIYLAGTTALDVSLWNCKYRPAACWNDRISFVPNGLSGRQLMHYRNKISVAIKAPVR